MPESAHKPVSAIGAATSPAPEPKPTLAAAAAIGSIARIIGKLSGADQKRVIAALAELK